MHILLVSHNYPHPLDHTYGFFCKTQSEALAANGQTVGVVGSLPISLKVYLKKRSFLFGKRRFRRHGVNLHLFLFPSIPKFQQLRYWVMKQLGIGLLKNYIKRYGKPDVVHLHVYHAAEIAIYALKRYGIPIVWTEHFQDIDNGLVSSYQLKLIKKLVQVASARIAVSKNLSLNLQDKFDLKFIYIPNMYDSELFKYDDQSTKNRIFTFAHVSSLNANKNQKRLLGAFKLAFESNDDVKLIIIGDGEDFDKIQGLIVELGLANKVVLMGSLSQEDIYDKLKKSHALVSSSNYETFGVGIVEAMACGLPAVATRSGGPESIIVEGLNGILTDRTDEALASGLKEIHLSFNKFDPICIAQFAMRNFSRNVVSKSLVGVYDSVVETKNL